MKNVTLSVILVCLASWSSAQNFFFEDFDGCVLPTDWTNESTLLPDTAWLFGDNAAGTPGGSVDGTCMAYVHDDDLGSGAPAFVTDLISPVIDLSSLDTAELQFDYIFEDLGTSYFAVALWNGADWDTVFTENTDPGCFGFFPECGPRSANINVTDYLNADFQIKFIFDDGAGWNWYIGLDNVAIYVPPTDDGALVEGVSPVSGCGLSATEMVSFSVFNNGQDTIQSVSITYSVNGGAPVNEAFVTELLSWPLQLIFQHLERIQYRHGLMFPKMWMLKMTQFRLPLKVFQLFQGCHTARILRVVLAVGFLEELLTHGS